MYPLYLFEKDLAYGIEGIKTKRFLFFSIKKNWWNWFYNGVNVVVNDCSCKNWPIHSQMWEEQLWLGNSYNTTYGYVYVIVESA